VFPAVEKDERVENAAAGDDVWQQRRKIANEELRRRRKADLVIKLFGLSR
jgi:hypothetical protein